jgi:hypothetical protein
MTGLESIKLPELSVEPFSGACARKRKKRQVLEPEGPQEIDYGALTGRVFGVNHERARPT